MDDLLIFLLLWHCRMCLWNRMWTIDGLVAGSGKPSEWTTSPGSYSRWFSSLSVLFMPLCTWYEHEDSSDSFCSRKTVITAIWSINWSLFWNSPWKMCNYKIKCWDFIMKYFHSCYETYIFLLLLMHVGKHYFSMRLIESIYQTFRSL